MKYFKNKIKNNNTKKLNFLKSSLNNLKKKEYSKNSNSNLNLWNISNEINTKMKENISKKKISNNNLISKNNLRTKELNKPCNKYKFSNIAKKHFIIELDTNDKKDNFIKKKFDNINCKNYKIKCKFIENYTVISQNKNENTLKNRISIFHNEFLINKIKKELNFFAIYESKLTDLIEFYKKYFHKLFFEIKIFYINIIESIKWCNNKLLIFYANNNNVDNIDYKEILDYKSNNKDYKYDSMINFRIIIIIDDEINFITNFNGSLLLSKNKGNSFTNIENLNLNSNKLINLNKYFLSKTEDFIILKNSYLEDILNNNNKLISNIWDDLNKTKNNNWVNIVNKIFEKEKINNNISFLLIILNK